MKREVEIIRVDELPFSNIAREFVGEDHGGVGICAIVVDAPPGARPLAAQAPLRRGPHHAGGHRDVLPRRDEQREVGPGQVVVVPAGQWHGFVNSGDGPLRQIDIHVSAGFETEWLEAG